MNFASDNWAGAHPEISENLSRHSSGFAPAYGASPIDKAVESRLREIFDHKDLSVFFVATGTAANAIAMAALSRPGGVAFAQSGAHMIADECGAPELQSRLRLHPVDGALGKIDPGNLEEAIARYPASFVHAGQPAAVSITQATEAGTVYSLDEIDAISAICKKAALPLHMDGARFANALVHLDATPAEMTWKRGVGMVSFGGTKNGCWCAEALLLFDPEQAGQIPFLRKRAGQLFSKSRFVAAQFDAYLRDDVWLTLARHANAKAAKLALVIAQAPNMRLAWPPGANEVFAIMPAAERERLMKAGAIFAQWHPPADMAPEIGKDEILGRFVTSFSTQDIDIEQFSDAALA